MTLVATDCYSSSMTNTLITHTTHLAIEVAEVDSVDGITEKQLGMVRSVRNALTADAREDSGLSFGRLACRALDVPITTMAGWVHPNESIISNVNLVLSMVDSPVMLGAGPAKTSDPFAGIEDSYELDATRPAVG